MNSKEIMEEITSLEEKIRILTFSLKSGVSTPPLFDLLDDLIDKLMLASMILREGTLSKDRNPSLIFLDRFDPILDGFPISIKIKDSRKEIIDESLSQILRSVAESLVVFKRQQSLAFLEQDIVQEVQRYRDKCSRRLEWSHDSVTELLFLLQEEFASFKEKQTILRFLQWINNCLWKKDFKYKSK